MSKIIIVTGGSRGIGRAAALAAAAAGYDVAISYREDRGAADDVVQRIRALDRRGLAVAADSADEGAVVSLFAEVDRQLGAVSALVNNAGIVGGSGRVEDMTADEVSRVLAINVTGCFTAAREAIKRMSTRRGGAGGSIVNISSAAARLGSPGEFVHYAASKGAIDTFTIGLAREVADEGIRVNAVRPGMRHAVADGRGKIVAQLLLQPGDGLVQCGRHIGDRAGGPSAVDQNVPVLALYAQRRAGPDSVDLPLQAPGESVVVTDREELELDARTAGVEDQDGLGHQVRTGFIVRR